MSAPVPPDAELAGLCAIAVMAKAPRPGQVKTRLQTVLEPAEAAQLGAAFLRDVTGNLAAAARLAPTDTSRVARALEVIRSTGRPLAAWQAERQGGIADRVRLSPLIQLPDRAELVRRIDARAAAMLAGGALEEVAALLARADVPSDAPVRRAIGVPEVAGLLAGTLSSDAALEQLRLATRRYAKRQYTWFRHQPPATWTRTTTGHADDLVI